MIIKDTPRERLVNTAWLLLRERGCDYYNWRRWTTHSLSLLYWGALEPRYNFIGRAQVTIILTAGLI